MCLWMLQDYEAMLEESKDIKLGFRYSQARTLFEDDPRWKVRSWSAGYSHTPCCVSTFWTAFSPIDLLACIPLVPLLMACMQFRLNR